MGQELVVGQNGGSEVPALLWGEVQSRGLVRGPMSRVGKGRQAPWPVGLGLGRAALAVGSWN